MKVTIEDIKQGKKSDDFYIFFSVFGKIKYAVYNQTIQTAVNKTAKKINIGVEIEVIKHYITSKYTNELVEMYKIVKVY